MDSRIAAALDAGTGVTSARALVAGGIGREEIGRAVRAGHLVRLRRNALVDGETWRSAKPWERHDLRARAVAASLPRGHKVALSHHSALALRGVSLFGVDDRVHLVHVDGGRGRTDRVVASHRAIPEALVEVHQGIRVVRPAAACLQVAAQFGTEAGLVSVDDALRSGLVSREACGEAQRVLKPERWSRAPAEALALADERVESAAESRARWAFHVLGFRQPTPQVVVSDETGRFVARVDFCYEDLKLVIEVDGMGKYTTSEDLIAEKRREDRLRELGYAIVRLTWEDLADHVVVRAKVLGGVARAA